MQGIAHTWFWFEGLVKGWFEGWLKQFQTKISYMIAALTLVGLKLGMKASLPSCKCNLSVCAFSV